MQFSRTTFDDIISRVSSVPTLPTVMNKLWFLVDDPEANARQISDLISRDAAMAAKMLRIVNGVNYSLSEPVYDLEQAIVHLGFKTVRAVALSIAVMGLFQQRQAGFDMRAFWVHGAVCAYLCRTIAARTHALDASRSLPGRPAMCDPEFAYIVGLLCKVGRLFLADNAPAETKAVIEFAREYDFSFTSACRQVMATDDTEVGAWLCERWELDGTLVDAIRHQGDLDLAPQPRLAAMCQLADSTCLLKRIRSPGDHQPPNIPPRALDVLGFTRSALTELLANSGTEIANARSLLKVVQ